VAVGRVVLGDDKAGTGEGVDEKGSPGVEGAAVVVKEEEWEGFVREV
jgi:hypothetical protein